MNTQSIEPNHDFSHFEELNDYAKLPVIIEKLPHCKLLITISAMFDRKKGNAAIEKQIACAKAYFESFKEKEIREFILITSEYRKKLKPDFLDLAEEKNESFAKFSNMTKEEKRQYKKAEKATEKRRKANNSQKSQYEEAQAFTNDAVSICCTRINEGAEKVNAYLAYYCKCAKYEDVEMISKVQDLKDTVHIYWEGKKDVF